MTTIRVVLVEDHALFRAGVRRELADLNRDDATTITVIGEAADRDEAIAVIRALRPDVVLLDVHLPGGGGDTVIRAFRDDQIDTRFLALSVSDAAEDVIAVVRAGRAGTSRRRSRSRNCDRPSNGCTLVTPCSHHASPVSYSTPSPVTSRCPPTPSSTNSPSGNKRCCV